MSAVSTDEWIMRDSNHNRSVHRPLKAKRGRELDICVEKFSSPYDFLAKVLHSKHANFVELQREISNHFNDHYLFCKSTVTNPTIGLHCVARTKDGVLHRAMIVKTFISSKDGYLSHCALVDEAKHACVPNRSLYESPDWVWRLPIQSACFGLHGIIPSKLRADYYEDTVKKIPCSRSRWDPAACAYLMRSCTNDIVLKAVVMETDVFGVIWVNLFMPIRRRGKDYLSINQELVRMEYAAVGTRDQDCDVDASSKDGLMWLINETKKVPGISDVKCFSNCDKVKDIHRNEKNVLLPDSTHESARCGYSVNADEESCNNVNSMPHDDCESAYIPKQIGSFSMCSKKKLQSKLFTRNGIFMRSIGLQVGGDVDSDSVESSEDQPLHRNFSCNVTESDLEPLIYMKRVPPVVNAEQHCQVSQNMDDREKNIKGSANVAQLCSNNFLQHIPFESSVNEDSGSSIPEKLDDNGEDSESDCDQHKPDLPKPVPGSVKSVFVPDKLHSGSIVLMRGSKPPNPLPLFCKTPFSAQFLRMLETDLNLRGPKLIQAYAWPAILDKRDTIAIAPARGGKSLAYVVPIAHMLVKDIQVAGNVFEQPSVIVITPDWTKAEKLRNMFVRFLGTSHRNHNVVTVCGGSPEEQMKASRLASGCSVLICSAPSFVRICDANYVDLSRLKHFVLDCIHVLVEEFFEEIKSVMKILANNLRTAAAHSKILKPPQVIGMGSQWTRGVESFMKNFLKNHPLLLISDPLEAAVFGNVQHKVLVTAFKDQLILLQDFFCDCNWIGPVTVFTDTPKSVETFADIFKSRGMYSVKAHGNMSHGELDIVRQELTHEASQLIIFATDDVVAHLDMYGIKIVIHLTVPASRHQFGVRLSVMQASFDNDSTGHSIERGRSIFLVNEQETDTLPDLVKFFERISLPVPDKLLSMAEEALKGGQGVSTLIPLCPTLQSLGICTDESVCRHRHRLTAADELTNHSKYSMVPAAGHVRVKVTHVVDATHYFGVCLAVKNEAGVITKFSDNRLLIAEDLEDCFKSSVEEDAQLSTDPYPGIVYGLTKTFKRVVVLRLAKPEAHNENAADFVIASYKQKLSSTFVCWTTPAGVRKACARFIDSGRVGVVRCDELFKIPKDLQSIPWQAIEVRVCGVRPNDRDRKWLPLADHMVHKNIFNKNLEGMVVAALGHTIWISPAVVRSKLPITKTIDTDFSVVQELLVNGYAQKYPEHIKLMTNFTSGMMNFTLKNKSEVLKPVKRFPPANNHVTDVDVKSNNSCPVTSETKPASPVCCAVKDVECHVTDDDTDLCSGVKQLTTATRPEMLTENSALQNVACHVVNININHHSGVEQAMADRQLASPNESSDKQNVECRLVNGSTRHCFTAKQQTVEHVTTPKAANMKISMQRAGIGYHSAVTRPSKFHARRHEGRLPPEFDNSDKSLESLCRRFCDMPLSESDRMNILLEIHVTAVGCFYDLSIEDLESLADVLPVTRTTKEALTVVGALLSLILDDVPIANSIALSPLVLTACNLKILDEDSQQLAVMLFKLTQAIIESLDVNDRVYPGVVSQADLMETIGELEQYLQFKVDERLSLEANHALVMAREYWAKKKSTEMIEDQVSAEQSRRHRAVKKPKPKPKISDRYGVNYDRFQDVTTETTDVDSVKRLYTPIPIKYDSDTSSNIDSETI